MNIESKNQCKYLVDITSLRSDYPKQALNGVRDELAKVNCTAKKIDYNGKPVMQICGNISEPDLVAIFNKVTNIDVEDYLITPGDWKNNFNECEVTEKRKGCCPPKKDGINERYVSLKECLNGEIKSVNPTKRPISEVIDLVAGKCLNESIADMAIQKAMNESKSKCDEIIENMKDDTFVKVVESLSNKSNSIYSNVIINKRRLAEYSNDEIVEMIKKVDEQISNISAKMAAMNESEGLNTLREKLDGRNRLKEILESEKSFRNAVKEAEEAKENKLDEKNAEEAVEFKNLNPNAEDEENKDEEAKSEDKEEKSEKSEEDTEENPDEDEIEELREIVIILSNEEAANNLHDDLVEAGIPEEAIEVKPADEEESDEEAETEADTENAEESGEDVLDDILDNEEEEKTEESAKSEKEDSKPVNEDEGDETEGDNTDAENAEDAPEGDESDAETEEETDKQFKVILVDTDYVNEFKQVLIDLWGVTEEEFVEMVGEIVSDEDAEDNESNDDEEESSEEEKSDKKEDKSEDSDDAADDGLNFDPDEIFKGL